MPHCTGDIMSELHTGFVCILEEGHPGPHRDRDGYERVRPITERCQVPGCVLYLGHPDELHVNAQGTRFGTVRKAFSPSVELTYRVMGHIYVRLDGFTVWPTRQAGDHFPPESNLVCDGPTSGLTEGSIVLVHLTSTGGALVARGISHTPNRDPMGEPWVSLSGAWKARWEPVVRQPAWDRLLQDERF